MIENSFLIVPAIWICILLAILILLSWGVVKVFLSMVELKKKLKKYVQLMKHRTDMQYNKYIALSPQDLNNLLCSIFAAQLELSSTTQISELDPDRAAKLYLHATEGTGAYIGKESIDAINYYYGKDYIFRWCEMKYRLLENHGVIKKVIAKEIYSETITKELLNV